MCCAVLCCAVLCCVVLCCVVLCSVVLCSVVQCCVVWWCCVVSCCVVSCPSVVSCHIIYHIRSDQMKSHAVEILSINRYYYYLISYILICMILHWNILYCNTMYVCMYVCMYVSIFFQFYPFERLPFHIRSSGTKSQIMSQDIQRSNQVCPLNHFTQWCATRSEGKPLWLIRIGSCKQQYLQRSGIEHVTQQLTEPSWISSNSNLIKC